MRPYEIRSDFFYLFKYSHSVVHFVQNSMYDNFVIFTENNGFGFSEQFYFLNAGNYCYCNLFFNNSDA